MAKTAVKSPVSQDSVEACLAWAVAQGDIVNLRLQFASFSPLRDASSENIGAAKYDYLHPENENDAAFVEAKGLLKDMMLRDQIKTQLGKKGPVQLPAELLLKLADNAVRLGKYGNAAQAYELLRIRPRMQELFLQEGDAALDNGDAETAVRAYLIAANLGYDYAAFPEPLPITRAYHKHALILHAVYPARPEDSIALQPAETHLRTAFAYLLMDSAIGRRLEKRPIQLQYEFLRALVRRIDPNWDEFTARYKEACAKVTSYGERLLREAEEAKRLGGSIANAMEEQKDGRDTRDICATLLGYAIPNGEWWQYLKDLAFKHPAATLFVARQSVNKELEVIIPRFVKGSQIISALGLNPE